MDRCEHDNDISGSMNAVYLLTPSDSQKLGAMVLVYNFYAVLPFSCNVFRCGVGEERRRSVELIV